jgi:hypothetical protein
MQTQTHTPDPAAPHEHTADAPKADRATNSKFRVRPAVPLLVLLIATLGAGGATSNAATTPIHHVTTLHVSQLTIDHDAATGRVSGFPPRQKVIINTAPYNADPTGTVDLRKARLHGLNRIELNFTDTHGYISTGTAALKHANNGLTLTRSQLQGATPQEAVPQTIKLTVLPVMFSPPPTRSTNKTKQ